MAERDSLLKELLEQLKMGPRYVLDEAQQKAPAKPGVYCIWEGNTLVYVGETGKISGRMRDLRDTRNHTFRRLVGKKYFHDRPGYKEGSTKHCFDEATERGLNERMKTNYRISFIPVDFGRKELEEHIINNHGDLLLNIKKARA